MHGHLPTETDVLVMGILYGYFICFRTSHLTPRTTLPPKLKGKVVNYMLVD